VVADVETIADYWERKREEVALLRELCGVVEEGWPRDGAALLAEKRRLRARMLARVTLDHPELTESNLTDASEHTVGRARVVYSYLRWDGKWSARRPAEEIYPRGALPWPRTISIGMLTSSGMAAVSGTLAALDRLVPAGTRLYIGHGSYFETTTFTRSHLHHLVEPPPRVAAAKGDVVFLDSITGKDWPAIFAARPLAPLTALVFDTTCYDASSPRIAAVVARATSDGVPLILVRSHIKLDCLGSEHGRLGSILVVLPRRASRAHIAFARNLGREMREVLRLTGASPFTPAHLFPPSSDQALLERFRRLNERRNERLVAGNAQGVAAMAAAAHPTTIVEEFHHQLFFQVQPFLSDPALLRGHREDLLARLRDAGLFALYAPSFGYDFIAVTQFVFDSKKTAVLRIALPDLPTEDVERFAVVIREWAPGLAPWER
jgi:hypothetical protein